MDNVQKSSDLLQLFNELKQIMIEENEKNWVRGVDLIIEALTPPDYGGKGGAEEAFKYVEATYRNMVSGNGSFSDFFIWRDEFKDREKANKELDRIRVDIWAVIDN